MSVSPCEISPIQRSEVAENFLANENFTHTVSIDFERLKTLNCLDVARRLGLEPNSAGKIRCFLHPGDNTPSFHLYENGWKCYGCGKHGDAVDLVSRYQGVDVKTAAEWLQNSFSIYPQQSTDSGRLEREHIYPGGQVKKAIYRKRDRSKTASWYHLEGERWVKGKGKDAPHILYEQGDPENCVFIVEGEKDADNLHKQLGYFCISGENGAGKWLPEYTEQLRGKTITILPDNDKPGRKYAQETAAALYGAAGSVKILDLKSVWPEMPEKGDISDMLSELGSETTFDLLEKLKKETPEWTPPKAGGTLKDPPPKLITISARDLQNKDIAPLTFIVEGLLPRGGEHLFCSPPKFGKSWLALDLCLSVAAGSRFLGYRTNQVDCLYLALEDSEHRLKTRMNRLLDGQEAPSGFRFATSCVDMDNGLLDQMESFVKDFPKTGLIVIDTFQKVRGAAHGREGSYANDYREAGTLKSFADTHNVSVLLVHHLRKMTDESDPFNRISGTNGLSGAADTMLVMERESRNSDNTTLHITGRDVESRDTVLKFEAKTCRWLNLGDSEEVMAQQARQEYEESPLVFTVKKLLSQSPGGWTGTAQDLLEAGRHFSHTNLATSARSLSNLLKSFSNPLMEYDSIVYERRKNGSGGGKHSFAYTETTV